MSQVTILKTAADVSALSTFTVFRLADALKCVFPHAFIPARIAAGDFLGVELTTDDLGNFVSCELVAPPLQMPTYTADMAAEDKAQERFEDGYRY